MFSQKPQIKRPWGGYTILKKSSSAWVKKLFVKKGMRLSLQSHEHREEVWIVQHGSIQVQIGTKTQSAKTGDVIIIPKRRKHRITGLIDSCVVEVAYGKVLEGDIRRYEDDFGRV